MTLANTIALTSIALLSLCGCGTSSAADDSPPTDAKDAVERCVTALREHRIGDVWALMPKSQRGEFEEILALVSQKVDPDVYTEGMTALKSLLSACKSKKSLIAKLVEKQLPPDAKEGSVSGLEVTNAFISAVNGLIGSKRIASVDKLGSLDVGRFLNEQGEGVFEFVTIAAKLGGADTRASLDDALRETTAVEKDVEGEHATLEITSPGDDLKPKTSLVEFVKVDDSWIPEGMDLAWMLAMGAAKTRLQNFEMGAAEKGAARQVIGLLEGTIKSIEDAETAEELEGALGFIMGQLGR